MMLNRAGFANKKGYPEPSYYKKCFDAWCAVYYDAADTEYHLQLLLDPWEWQRGYRHAKAVEVLIQFPTHRVPAFYTPAKTIKAALEQIVSLLQRINKKGK